MKNKKLLTNILFAAVVLAQLPVEEWRKCRSASQK